MKREALRQLAASGMRAKIAEIERELAGYHEEFPELFLSSAPPMLLKSELTGEPPAAHWNTLQPRTSGRGDKADQMEALIRSKGGTATIPELMVGLGVTRQAVHNTLNTLKKRQVITRKGKGDRYRLTNTPPPPPGAHAQAPHTPDTRRGRILAYVQAHPGSSRRDIANGLGGEMSPDTVSVDLWDLRRQGLVENDTRARTWRATGTTTPLLSGRYRTGPAIVQWLARHGPSRPRDIRRAIKRPPKAVSSALGRLIKKGQLASMPDGRYALAARQGTQAPLPRNGRGA